MKRPRNRKVMTSRWVFAVKDVMHENNSITEKAKARLVVRGFQQVPGVDFYETFAPVAKFTTVRAVLAAVAKFDLELHQMDVKTAFLNGELEEDIYMEVPDGVKVDNSADVVCKLKKAMYGLKQASRQWNIKIDEFLVNYLGFEKCVGDACLYIRRDEKAKTLMIIVLYVDDLLLAGNSMQGIKWMKRELNNKFEMKDLGEASMCLGFEISRNRNARKLFLGQERYAEKVLERFRMSQCYSVPIPMENVRDLEKRLESKSVQPDLCDAPYREAIGSLMYLMIGTRPDIAFAVSKLSRYLDCAEQKHWNAVKRVLRYVKGTKDFGICFDGTKDIMPVGYSDSDWAGDVNDRKSTGGYVFTMCGGPISWSSRKQSVVATSSCEAEYIALCAACKEAIWVMKIVSPLIKITEVGKSVTIFSDSQSAIALSLTEAVNRRNKHIAITYHFVREVVDDGRVKLEYIPTKNMLADTMTKPLGRVKFQGLREVSGIFGKGEF